MKKISASVLMCLLMLAVVAEIRAQQSESKDRFLFTEGRFYGYLDQTGQAVIKPQFIYAEDFFDGLARVGIPAMQKGVYTTQEGYIDKAGNLVIKLPLESTGRPFSDGLALILVDGKWVYIDKTGKRVIEGTYQGAWDFFEGMALVKLDGKFTFIDKTGKMITDPIFDEVKNFSGGLAYVHIGSRWGYIDKQGKYVWLSH